MEFAETVNMHFSIIVPNLTGDSNLKYDIHHCEPKSLFLFSVTMSLNLKI